MMRPLSLTRVQLAIDWAIRERCEEIVAFNPWGRVSSAEKSPGSLIIAVLQGQDGGALIREMGLQLARQALITAIGDILDEDFNTPVSDLVSRSLYGVHENLIAFARDMGALGGVKIGGVIVAVRNGVVVAGRFSEGNVTLERSGRSFSFFSTSNNSDKEFAYAGGGLGLDTGIRAQVTSTDLAPLDELVLRPVLPVVPNPASGQPANMPVAARGSGVEREMCRVQIGPSSVWLE